VWFCVSGTDPSSEGVQRDLLPIIEGSVVNTKHGAVATDHILFICSGAFHSSKPSDMMAELQVRGEGIRGRERVGVGGWKGVGMRVLSWGAWLGGDK
jgi:hypothetical protein